MNPARGFSTSPTAWAVDCPACGTIYLTDEEYDRQMWLADRRWQCPVCKGIAEWNDEIYEAAALTQEDTP